MGRSVHGRRAQGLSSPWMWKSKEALIFQESTEPVENKVGKKGPKHLDDDEDRKNPAYIPRKGLFFEHDLRGQTQEEEVR
jgi:protein CASC3